MTGRTLPPIDFAASERGLRSVGVRTWWTGRLGLALLAFVPAVQPLFEDDGMIPLSTRLLASVLWLATLAPAWNYLATPSERRRPVPFLPVVGLLYGLYYALPILLDAELLNLSVWIDPQSDYQPAVEGALLGWGALLAGYGVWHREDGWSAFRDFPLSDAGAPVWGARLLVGGLTVKFVSAAVPTVQALSGLVNFLNSLAIFGLALLIMGWRRGLLSGTYKGLVVGCALALTLVEIGTGLVATLGFAFITIGLAYWAAVPTRVGTVAWTALIAGACFVLVLKGVTKDFRAVAWYGDARLSVVERAELAGGLVQNRVGEVGALNALTSGTDATTSRSSNADLLAEVIRRTPADVPYWNGQTYLSLVGALVPRLLWPDKPTKDLGQDFGHRYGYLDPEDLSTSYNLPWLVEAYANAGLLGIALVGFVVGLIYSALFRLINAPGQSIWTTAAGIVVLAPLFNIESDFSLVFGGLPLTLAVMWIVVRQIAAVERGRRPLAAA